MTTDSIRVGSIISLQSIANSTEGGYLNTLGWVTDIPVITHFHDPAVRAFVTTHITKERSDGSGSWQILSAEPEKQLGDKLNNGDKIHLLNMQSGAGYLDTFEWVHLLEPFKGYFPAMRIGVFTSNVPKRGGGVSGTWTIQLADTSQAYADAPIKTNAEIFLENAYPGAGFLYTYQQVKDHPNGMFQAYKDEAAYFVFTGPVDDSITEGTRRWKITLIGASDDGQQADSHSNINPKSVFRIENQWGDAEDAPWHETGIFKIGDGQKGQLKKLTLSDKQQVSSTKPDQQTHTLTGKVKFADSIKYDINVVLGTQPNRYAVTLTPSNEKNEKETVDEIWVLGSREFQKVTRLKIKEKKDNLTGEIQYEGERPIRLRATPATVDNEILYDYFNPDLLKGRTQKMQGVIDTTYKLLSENIKAFKKIEKTVPRPETAVDFVFQQNQLHNLQLLSKILNAFYDYKLKYLMKQAFKNHRNDQTLAPLYLVRQAFQRLATDHEIIQQAAVQRRWTHGIKKDEGYFVSEQAVELMIMDKLAIKAITPFADLLGTGKNDKEASQLAIISYLSDRTHIRHLPYTDQFILIGVSYDRVPLAGSLFDDKPLFERPFHAFELMAIPHEVGHYIYEHGKLADGRTFANISKQFEGNNPYYRWGEEIFADLYGCIVTGPLTVLSMRALLVSINRERAWKDDEHHPTPVLRVFLLNEMLRILKDMRPEKYNFANVTAKLDKDWANILESWGYAQVNQGDKRQVSERPSRIYLHDNSNIHLEQIVNVDRVINAIRPIIIEFATLLLDHLDKQKDVPIPWVSCTGTSTSKSVEDNLDEYSKKMRKMTSRTFAAGQSAGGQKLSIKVDKEKPDMANPDNPKKSFLPDELLYMYLDNWGDSGPFGIGGH